MSIALFTDRYEPGFSDHDSDVLDELECLDPDGGPPEAWPAWTDADHWDATDAESLWWIENHPLARPLVMAPLAGGAPRAELDYAPSFTLQDDGSWRLDDPFEPDAEDLDFAAALEADDAEVDQADADLEHARWLTHLDEHYDYLRAAGLPIG